MQRSTPGPYRTVFLFDGQGSQYHQMGRELFEHNATFRQWMERGEQRARACGSPPLLEVIYDPDQPISHTFDETRISHPAIFLVEYALAQCLAEIGIRPNAVLATSLGSFAAAAVAGALPFETAVEAVVRQGALLSETCPPGGMLAILAPPDTYERTPTLRNHSTLAGTNFRRHFVVSGTPEDLDTIQESLKRQHVPMHRLPVRFGFHSHLIDPAAEPFQRYLENRPLSPWTIPCLSAGPPPEPPTFLWDAIRHPMNFQQLIENQVTTPTRYLDLGPSGTLTAFLKRILPRNGPSTVYPILTPQAQGIRNLEQIRQVTAASR